MERITIEKEKLIDRPLYFHKMNLQETASGYGSKLTTRYMVNYNGRIYRMYCSIWSNIGTCYIVSKGKDIIVNVN